MKEKHFAKYENSLDGKSMLKITTSHSWDKMSSQGEFPCVPEMALTSIHKHAE